MFTYVSSLSTFIGVVTGSVIGMSVLSSLVSLTCSKTYDLIGSYATCKNPDFKEVYDYIKKNDLLSKILRIEQVIYDSDKIDKKSVQISKNHINEILNLINDTLKELKEKEEYYNSLYFKNWRFRKYNCKELLDKLKDEVNILEIRFNDLTKII